MAVEAVGRRDMPVLDDVAAPPERWTWFGRFAVRRSLRGYDLAVRGYENLPATGPVIVASNHIGYLDGPLLFSTAPRPVHALVKESMFVGPMGFGLRRMGQIRVDRFNTDPFAIKQSLRVLRAGGVLAIYPEGARGRGDVVSTKGGAAYLALVTGAPVVPAACLGTRLDGEPTDARPPRGCRLELILGEPMRFEPIPWPRTRDRVADVQQAIQEALSEHVRRACRDTGYRLPGLPDPGVGGGALP